MYVRNVSVVLSARRQKMYCGKKKLDTQVSLSETVITQVIVCTEAVCKVSKLYKMRKRIKLPYKNVSFQELSLQRTSRSLETRVRPRNEMYATRAYTGVI